MKKVIKSCIACVACLSIFSSETSGMFLKKDGTYNESNQIRSRSDILDGLKFKSEFLDDSSRIFHLGKVLSNNNCEITEDMLDDYRYENIDVMIIPSNITEIGDRAFEEFQYMQLVRLTSNIKTISYAAFAGCTNLSVIDIPNSVTYISGNAFEGCHSLKRVVLPINVTQIENNTFFNCTSLKKVKILSNTIRICEEAFEECAALETLLINSSIVKIDENAFKNCKSLSCVSIHSDEWILINQKAFSECDQLTNITVGQNSLTKADFLTHYNQPDSLTVPAKIKALSKLFTGDDHLRVVNFENESMVSCIERMAFWGCEKLTSITIPSTVTHISEMAFEACSNLKRISIPSDSNIDTISKQSFLRSGLESISIPLSTKHIGAGAFGFCEHLVIVEIPKLNIKVGANLEDIFGNCSPDLRIYISRERL